MIFGERSEPASILGQLLTVRREGVRIGRPQTKTPGDRTRGQQLCANPAKTTKESL